MGIFLVSFFAVRKLSAKSLECFSEKCCLPVGSASSSLHSQMNEYQKEKEKNSENYNCFKNLTADRIIEMLMPCSPSSSMKVSVSILRFFSASAESCISDSGMILSFAP